MLLLPRLNLAATAALSPLGRLSIIHLPASTHLSEIIYLNDLLRSLAFIICLHHHLSFIICFKQLVF